jgi:hypothetical protein
MHVWCYIACADAGADRERSVSAEIALKFDECLLQAEHVVLSKGNSVCKYNYIF